ncbi:MAG TPA: NAD-dependent epimerase/dehydratase family protein [Marmoricola sp.]
MTRVAVTGAAGFLGVNVVREFVTEGYEVRALDRVVPPGAADLVGAPDGVVTWQTADVLDETAMTAALEGVDLVVHLVAVVTLKQEDPLAWRVNVDGVGNVARAALAAGVRRMVDCSSLAAFDYERGAHIDETAPRAMNPALPVYHRSKYAGEVELHRVVEDGLDGLVCNPTGVFGPVDHPDRLSRMNQAMLDAARGRMPVSTTGDFDMVDVRDVARGLRLAAEKGRTGENYFLGGHRFGLAAAQRLAAREVGGRGPVLLIPSRVLGAIAPLLDPVTSRLGSEAFSPAGLENIVASPVVDHGKAARELGYEPRRTEESVADLVAFFRDRGLLA